MVTRAQSFSDIFKIAAADKDGIYWHASGAASFCWLAHPISAEHLTGATRHFEIANRLGQAISSLPDGATVQFICANIPNVDWAIADYLQAGGSSNHWLRQFETMKAKAFKNWCLGLKDTVDADVTAKAVQVLIVVTIYRGMEESSQELWKSVKDALGPVDADEGLVTPVKALAAHGRAVQEATAIRDTLLAKVANFEKAFTAMRLPRVRCDVENFVRFVRTQIHPNTGAREPVIVDDEVFLPELICRQRIETAGRGKFMVSDDAYQVCLTADSYANPIYAGILSLNNQRLESELSPIDLLKDCILCINMRVVGDQESVAWIDHQQKLAGKGGSDRTEDQDVFRDCEEAKSWVRREKRKLVDMCISVKANGPSEHAAMDRAREVIQIFQQLDFHFRVEDTDCETIWAEMLPGGFSGNARDGGHRYRRKKDIIATAVAPLYMSGRGTKTYLALNFNEHYEPSAFNCYDHPRSFNALFTGEPGSGKSNTMGSLATDALRPDNSKAFFIDYGGSYVNLVNLLDKDGHDQPLSLDVRQPQNVFAGPMDVTIPMLLDWIPSLFLKDNETVDPVVSALIEKALRAAYEERLLKDREFTDYADLAQQYRGMFPTNVRKRFAVRYLEGQAFQHVRDVLKGDEINRPRFELYLVVRLRGFMNAYDKKVPVSKLKDIDHKAFEKLNAQFKYLEEDESGAYLLAATPESVDSLERQGWEVMVDKNTMIVEAQRIGDFRAVMHAGAHIVYDPEFIEKKRLELHERHRRKYGDDHPDLAKFVREDLDRINPDEYFENLLGLADLQEEIVFSDFIRHARRLQDEKINDVLARLSSWHGDGIYADFFDRRGGVDLAKYKAVNFDFKPIFPPACGKQFATAMLGATLTRIAVYCNSVTTMNERKIVVIDEYHQFKKDLGPAIVRFVDKVTLQARKNGYCCWVGTQKFDHVAEDGLVDQFQHYFIGAQLPASHKVIQQTLEATDEQMWVVGRAHMEPGRYCDMCLYIPATGVLEIIRMVQTPFEYWLRSTYHEERRLRIDTITKYTREYGYSLAEATILAAKECAEKHPRGLRVTKHVEI